ncbi:Electron transfer DM13 [Leptolyngbyaceae cyanobacterium JSC-12]|nr:Electron transfer DM13 [Leptolyngbyaceae cyanobacterium JSC-12]
MVTLKHWSLLSLLSFGLMSAVGGIGNQAAASFPSSTPNFFTPSIQSMAQSAAIAQSASGAKSTILKSGSFVPGEHPTQGTARIISQNGKNFLELDQTFKTSEMGPDLVVILHRSSNVLASTKPPAYPLKTGDYVLLAPLQKFSGAQRYAIPANVNLANYQSAAIWCRKFNATFGAAKLN